MGKINLDILQKPKLKLPKIHNNNKDAEHDSNEKRIDRLQEEGKLKNRKIYMDSI